MPVFVAVYYSALFGPLLLIPLLWVKHYRSGSFTLSSMILLLTSICYFYLLLALRFKDFLLGPDYSDRLFATVQVGTSITAALSVLAAFTKAPNRLALLGIALTVTLAWFLVWAINTTI